MTTGSLKTYRKKRNFRRTPGKLRHPRFKGLRSDKKPKVVVREK